MDRPVLLVGGTVLTCDPRVSDLLTGDLRIENGRITDVESRIAVRPDDLVLDISGKIVFPGLVDAHQHLWEAPFALQEPDLSLAQYLAEFVGPKAAEVDAQGLHDTVRQALRTALEGGVTTTLDWCHAANSPEHAYASLDAGRQSGARYVFGYGPPVALGYYRSDRPHPEHLEQLADATACDSLVRVAAALRGPDLSPLATCLDDIRRARVCGLVVSMHIGTRALGPGGVQALVESGVLGDDMHFIHATDSSGYELRALAEAGATLVIPPIAEVVMGTGSPPFRRAADAGLDVALGVDTVLGAPSGMFEQMRAAMQCLRDSEWEGWKPPSRSSCRDVLTSATLHGARACGMAAESGSLAVGKFADLVVFDPPSTPRSVDQAYAQVVWGGHASRIRSVFVAGQEVVHHAHRS